MLMDDRIGAVTVRVVLPVTLPDAALTVVLPTPADVASPPEAIVATEVLEEDQVAVAVRFCVVPFE
jgi:hypothetical protein